MSDASISDKHEKEILRLLEGLGLRDINGGRDFKLGNRQIDAVGGYESTLIVVECTTQKDLGDKIDTFRGKTNEIISASKQDDIYFKYSKFRFVLVAKDREVMDVHSTRANNHKPRIYIWDDAYVSFYSSITNSIGKYAKYGLLSELNIKPDAKHVSKVPAFSTRVGKKGKYRLFSFLIDAQDLLKISYVARRESGGETYYQRMISKSRMQSIAKYIDKGKCFPNSIVVALDKNSWSFKEYSNDHEGPKWISIGTLALGNSFNSCWVIDGQHRLYSHVLASTQGKLIVSAFANISQVEQAEYFLDINREAKRVSANLLWDLLGSISPGSPDGVISNAVKRLRSLKGLFHLNIKIPSLGKGKFGFNSLCVSLEKNELGEEEIGDKFKKRKNPYYDDDIKVFVKDLSNGVNKYFSILDELLNDLVKKQLYLDGFISIFVSLLKLLIIHAKGNPSKKKCEEMLQSLAAYLNELDEEDLVKIRKSLGSEGGRTYIREDFIKILQSEFHSEFAAGLIKDTPTLSSKIQEIEYELNRSINSFLKTKTEGNWIETYIKDSRQLKSINDKSRQTGREPWECINFGTTINNVILNNSLWGRFFKDIFFANGFTSRDEIKSLSSRMWNYRSAKIHGGPRPPVISREAKNLVKSIHDLFRKVIIGIDSVGG